MATEPPSITQVESEFKRILGEQTDAFALWHAPKEEWTKVMTRVLATLGKSFNPDAFVAAKGHAERHFRSEHLALDVVLFDGALGPLTFAAEHENTPSMSVLEYTAWKLLNVRAPIRLMVGYWDAQADVTFDHQALIDGIKAVTDKFRGESLIVVSADKSLTFANSTELAAAFLVQRVP